MRAIIFPILAISIASFPGFVKAAAVETSAKVGGSRTSKAKGMTIEAFVQKSLSEAEDHPIGRNVGRDLGFEDAMPCKAYHVSAEDSVDKMSRESFVVLENDPSEGPAKPISWVLMATRKSKSGAQNHWFKLTLDGALEKAFTIELKYGENGKAIPGSGIVTQKDVEASAIKAGLNRELDFWLKGMYRAIHD